MVYNQGRWHRGWGRGACPSTFLRSKMTKVKQGKKEPSEHFKVVSSLFLGWYDVATSDNVKSTLKQRCVCQRWNLQHWTTSNQRCLFQCWFKKKLGNVETTLSFSKSIYTTFEPRRNNVVNMTIKKMKKNFESITHNTFKFH